MGSFIDDKQFVNDNTAEFAKKVKNQFSIFMDKAPTFVHYFHIVPSESTKDTGLQAVEKLTGVNSPTRYNLIKDFPIYGIEQIVLNLTDDDIEGIDTEFDGEGIILPNTIKPLPDDYFAITVAGKKFFFRVSEFSYDTIMSNNYYKISFMIKAADDETYYQNLMGQTLKTYTTIFRNFGTEDKFIIEEDELFTIKELNKHYDLVSKRYKMRFYDKKFNAMLVQDSKNEWYYDAYVNRFINEHNLFARDAMNLLNMRMYEEENDAFDCIYSLNSFQAVVNDKNPSLLYDPDEFYRYYDKIPTFTSSIFKYYGEYTIHAVEPIAESTNIYGVSLLPVVSDDFITFVKSEKTDGPNLVWNAISAYMHDQSDKIGEVLRAGDMNIKVKDTYEDYYLIPTYLYALISYYNTIMKSKVDLE